MKIRLYNYYYYCYKNNTRQENKELMRRNTIIIVIKVSCIAITAKERVKNPTYFAQLI